MVLCNVQEPQDHVLSFFLPLAPVTCLPFWHVPTSRTGNHGKTIAQSYDTEPYCDFMSELAHCLRIQEFCIPSQPQVSASHQSAGKWFAGAIQIWSIPVNAFMDLLRAEESINCLIYKFCNTYPTTELPAKAEDIFVPPQRTLKMKRHGLFIFLMQQSASQ